jgi:hypothetical protein
MRSRLTALLGAAVLLASSSSFAQPRDRADEDEDDEEPRPQWLYLSTEAGVQHTNLNAFLIDEQRASAGFENRSATGPMIGIGAGLRVFVLTIGPRARLGLLDELDMATIGGELGLRVPVGIFEPHVDLGGGYAAVSQLQSPTNARELSADGYYGRVGGGLDVHVSRAVTVGGGGSVDLFAVAPDGVSPATADEIRRDTAAGDRTAVESNVRRAEGSGYGTALSFGVTLGFHY